MPRVVFGSTVDRRIRRVLGLQFALWPMLAAGALGFWGRGHAVAVWVGLVVATANTLLLAWRMRPKVPKNSPASLSEFFRSWFERYLLVGAALALGLGFMKLTPLGLLGGFVVGQLAWLVAPFTIKEK